MEEWRDILDYEGVYQVSSLGNIRRWRKKYKRHDLLKVQLDKKKGYYRINLCLNSKIKKFWVHSLVARVFLNHIPNGMASVIDHIDNNKLNNSVDNLQIISNRENLIKGINFRRQNEEGYERKALVE